MKKIHGCFERTKKIFADWNRAHQNVSKIYYIIGPLRFFNSKRFQVVGKVSSVKVTAVSLYVLQGPQSNMFQCLSKVTLIVSLYIFGE